LLSVVVAVAALVAVLAILRFHDLRTDELLAAKEAETKTSMAQVEDDYRKITLKLGFNLMILPKDQQPVGMLSDEFSVKFMPEDYANKLAKSGIVTINHLLPSLQQRVYWESKKRWVLVV